jgi:hypothetical protein
MATARRNSGIGLAIRKAGKGRKVFFFEKKKQKTFSIGYVTN